MDRDGGAGREADPLLARLTAAGARLPGPLAVVDLDRFDANVADVLRRAGGRPVRLASKSVRVRALVHRALDRGFTGVMAYSLAEAIWLARDGVEDILVGYPSVDARALAALAADRDLRRGITLMVDDVAQLRLIVAALRAAGALRDDAGWPGVPGVVDGGPPAGGVVDGRPQGQPDEHLDGEPPVLICLDVDASLRAGPAAVGIHLGVRRSPLHTPAEVARVAAVVAATPGLRLRGLMFYEAQVAGLPDTRPAVRLVKRLSVADLGRRRRAVLAAVAAVAGPGIELVNSGGTGSLETSSSDPVVTEVTAGSGLYAPGLFDGYRLFAARPAAFFGLDVARVPARGWATAFGGGYIASGPAATSRLPRVATPGWRLTSREGAGEVQTPLRRRDRSAAGLAVGDRVWFRHAKAGELMERFDQVYLIRGDRIVADVPTYRGEGHAFG